MRRYIVPSSLANSNQRSLRYLPFRLNKTFVGTPRTWYLSSFSTSTSPSSVIYGGYASSTSSSVSKVGGGGKRITLNTLQKKRQTNVPISVLTAYDTSMAKAMDDVVDIILVGDSVGMVVLGQNSTIPVTLDTMIHHSQAVARGSSISYLVADLPFGSYTTVNTALRSATRLIQEGNMHSVKLEGGKQQISKIKAIVNEGIPVMGHIGLLPQTALLSPTGGYNLKGKTTNQALNCIEDALSISQLGIFSMVMEMIPSQLALLISNLLPSNVFTIGIGAGPYCHGQVLVSYDMLGMYNNQHVPKFVKPYAKLYQPMHQAFSNYASEVHQRKFPYDFTNASTASASSPSSVPPHKYYQDMPLADLEELQKAVHKLYPNEKEALTKFDHAVEEFQIHSTGSKLSIQPASHGWQKSSVTVSESSSPPKFSNSKLAVPEHNLRIGIIGSGAIASLLSASLSYLPNRSTITIFSSWDKRLTEIQEKGIGWRSNITNNEGFSIPSAIQITTSPSTVSLNETCTKSFLRAINQVNEQNLRRTKTTIETVVLPKQETFGNLEGHIGAYDVLFLCGKAHQVCEQGTLASLLVKSVTDKGLVVPLYNGAYTLEYLQKLFQQGYSSLPTELGSLRTQVQSLNANQILYGQTAMGSRMVTVPDDDTDTERNTIVEHTGYGPIHLCVPPIYNEKGITKESIEQIKNYHRLVQYLSQASCGNGSGHWLLQVKSYKELYSLPHTESLRWTKLALNSVLNPIVALFGVPNGGFLSIYKTNLKFRKLIEQLCTESSLALENRSQGSVRLSGNELLTKVQQIATSTANNSNSMMVDLAQGNHTEIDFINGIIAETLRNLHAKAEAHEDVIRAVYARQDLVEKNDHLRKRIALITEVSKI